MAEMADPDTLAADYERHAAAKEARIASLLADAGLGGLFRGLRRCPVERGWRTRASFYFAGEGDGRRPVGVDPRRGRIALEETVWTLPEHARPLAVEIGRRLAREGPEVTGFELRLELGSRRAHLNVGVVRGEGDGGFASVCEELRAEHPELLGAAVPSRGVEAGETELRNVLLGKTVLADYRAFFQTNWWLTEPLAAAAKEGADGAESIVDLYCGVGLHSVLAAGPGTRIVGADTNRHAIESARRNALLHGLDARYERATVERLMETGAVDRPAAVFVNPSRFGCAPGLAEAVARWRPGAVCLVSCSVDAHVRDTAAFAAAGYRPEPFGSFDMFPFSDFAESVTVFRPER